MSDDKLCPMTFNVAPTEERVGSGVFNCLGERCGWWIETAPNQVPPGFKAEFPGHCAMLELCKGGIGR